MLSRWWNAYSCVINALWWCSQSQLRPWATDQWIHWNSGKAFCANQCPLSQEDSQRYYRWRSYGPGDRRMEELWVDLNAVQQSKVRVHGILSNTHRQAAVRHARMRTHTQSLDTMTLPSWLTCCLIWYMLLLACGSLLWLPLLWTLPETNHHSNRR
jgi:hypothetical protein